MRRLNLARMRRHRLPRSGRAVLSVHRDVDVEAVQAEVRRRLNSVQEAYPGRRVDADVHTTVDVATMSQIVVLVWRVR
jgi:hypothetical protein